MSATVTWTENMTFRAEVDGHTLSIDAAPEHGGSNTGPRPKPLLLVALGGCAGMDVMAILKKMRQPVESLSFEVDADLQTATHPHTFENFRVNVNATGAIAPDRLWRAVALSRDSYCGVAGMLRAHSPITYRVWLNGEELPEPAAK